MEDVTKETVRQVADAETEDNDDHGAYDVHLAGVTFLPASGGAATCRLMDTARRRCRRLDGPDDAALTTNDADDSAVGEEEERRRNHVVPDQVTDENKFVPFWGSRCITLSNRARWM